MQGKRVVVGITGGIAVYKAAELVRLLVKAGAETRVAMTAHAARFVTPLTFEALSRNRVISDMWAPENSPMDHITWGQEADLIIVAPATANFIAKMAHGLGDDFLSTMLLASTAKVLICPAMNTCMFQHPAVRENLGVLKQRGVHVLDPSEGELACGTEGPGRLQEPEAIAEEAEFLLTRQDLAGIRFLITAGATVEPLDPVRYITNRSSGKMGYALARAAAMRGAEVTLVSGPTHLTPPPRVRWVAVNTTEEMRRAVLERSSDSDVVIKAAAVLDYRPRERSREKIKKGDQILTLTLEPNPDILAELGRARGGRPSVLVGFAAETSDLLAHAKEKLEKKNLDLIVANDVTRADAGFDSDTNLIKILYRDGTVEDLPLMTKLAVAHQLLDKVKGLWERTSGERSQ
ncbi:MAG: bifunctional phosphopantothenoylcysteine decarboxylase/phosphopantothenate--cysteine ligase CoaBC [Thermodesulfobacteriota bacterium]